MSGVVLISFTEYVDTQKFKIEGIIWSLISALGYAAYLVNLRRKVKNEDQMSLPMFFGFVGFWTIICLWPGLIILNIVELEPFELPSRQQLGSMLLNGFIGTLGAELLWLWGCFLTSSLAATLSLGLTIPLSMIADYLIKEKVYNWKFYLGSIPILGSFIIIAYLTSESNRRPKDPIGDFFKMIFCRARNMTTYQPLAETDSESEDANESRLSSLKSDTFSHSINSEDLVPITESIGDIGTGFAVNSFTSMPILPSQTRKNLANPNVTISRDYSSINSSSGQ